MKFPTEPISSCQGCGSAFIFCGSGSSSFTKNWGVTLNWVNKILSRDCWDWPPWPSAPTILFLLPFVTIIYNFHAFFFFFSFLNQIKCGSMQYFYCNGTFSPVPLSLRILIRREKKTVRITHNLEAFTIFFSSQITGTLNKSKITGLLRYLSSTEILWILRKRLYKNTVDTIHSLVISTIIKERHSPHSFFKS